MLIKQNRSLPLSIAPSSNLQKIKPAKAAAPPPKPAAKDSDSSDDSESDSGDETPKPVAKTGKVVRFFHSIVGLY